MRHNLIRATTIAATLAAVGLGLSACVTEGYDSRPRYGYYDAPRYGYYDRHDHRWDRHRGHGHHRHDQRGWVDRDGDGRRDWWESRR